MNRTKRESAVLDPPSAPAPTTAEMQQLAHRELVRRVVASPTLAKSERLCSLLTFVCEMTFKGRESEINEQKIGNAVFGRSQNYDSSIDGIVRTQASRLRLRLDLYFQQEGAYEPVRIIIPKGGYVPVFQPVHSTLPQETSESRQTAEVINAALSATSSVSVADQPPSFRSILPWTLCVFLTLAFAGLFLHYQTRLAGGAGKAFPHPLWSQIFTAEHPTIEVPGDSGLVIYHTFEGRRISLSEYLLGDYRSAKMSPSHPVLTEKEAQEIDLSNRRYTSVVDLEAVARLTQIADSAHSTMQVRYPRDLRPNDLKSGNVILFGAFEANPWVELFEHNMNFILNNDYKTRTFSVVNQSPQAGEPSHWDSISTDPKRRVYGLVAFTPNLSGNSNALIVEGTTMAGTEAAWDFVSDDSELLPFLKRIQRPDGSIPHFELLLETQNMSSSAVHINPLAWRIIS